MTEVAGGWLRARIIPRIAKASYVPILAAAMVAMFVRLLLMAKLLSVDQFAIFSTVMVASNLIIISASLGLFIELQRVLPIQLEFTRRREAARQIFMSIIGCGIVCAGAFVVMLSAAIFYEFELGYWLIGVVHGFVSQMFLIATTESRSNGEPLRYSIQNISRALSVFASSVLIAAETGSALAVLIADIVVTLVLCTLMLRRSFKRFEIPMTEGWRLGWRKIAVLKWPPMLLLVMVSVTGMATVNVDRWIAVYSLSKPLFAQYSFAAIVLTCGASVQALINASVYPALAKRLARCGYAAAFRLSLVTSGICLGASAILFYPGVAFMNYLVARFYPSYLDALPLISILSIVAILRLADFWASLLIISGSVRAGVAINVIALVAPLCVWYVLSRSGTVTVSSIGYFVLSVSILTYTLSALQCWRDAHHNSSQQTAS